MPDIHIQNVCCTYPTRRFPGDRTFRSRIQSLLTAPWNSDTGLRERVVALEGVSLRARAGDVLGIVGENGAGKTTLLRVVAGLLRPDSGRVLVNGSMSTVFGLGAGFLPALTGRENIQLVASLHGLSKQKIRSIESRVIEFSGLEDAVDRPLKTFSAGMRARLGFSIVCFLDTDIIALDEALSAGDVKFRHKAGNLVERFAHERKILLVVSHSTSVILQHCNKACYLHKGQIRSSGDPKEVCESYLESRQQAGPEPR